MKLDNVKVIICENLIFYILSREDKGQKVKV